MSQPGPLLPGLSESVKLARRAVKPGARVVVVADDALQADLDQMYGTSASRTPFDAPACDLIVCRGTARFGAPMPVAAALARAAPRAVVAELVWSTAPTPQLARAFAPTLSGHDKVRPVEAFEMQMEEAGWSITERVDLGASAWRDVLPASDPRRAALDADERGAARVAVRALSKRAPQA